MILGTDLVKIDLTFNNYFGKWSITIKQFHTEAFSKPCQITKMEERFAKNVNGFRPLTSVAKRSNFDRDI